MSENKSGDDQDQYRGREPQLGLSLSREEAEHRSTAGRSRPSAGVHAKLRQAVQVDKSVVERWFLPFAVLILILLVTGMALYIARSSQLSALEHQVAALSEQAAITSPDAELGRLEARVEALGDPANAVDDMHAEIQALRSAVTEQNNKIEVLTGRLDKLGQPSSPSGGAGSQSSDAGASGSQSAQASEQAGNGDWVINLITVADRAAAETFQKRLDNLGVDSRIEVVTLEDKSLQRVVVPGFDSRQAAENAGADLRKRLELSDDPWITQQ